MKNEECKINSAFCILNSSFNNGGLCR
jgi:hypothetical protein